MSGVNGGTEPRAFGELVRIWRDKRNMSMNRLAQLAGVTTGYISLIESGRRGRRPSRDVVLKVAQALNAPIRDFLEAAGRAEPQDYDRADRPSFEAFVNSDPMLTADQKRALTETYFTMVPSARPRRGRAVLR